MTSDEIKLALAVYRDSFVNDLNVVDFDGNDVYRQFTLAVNVLVSAAEKYLARLESDARSMELSQRVIDHSMKQSEVE